MKKPKFEALRDTLNGYQTGLRNNFKDICNTQKEMIKEFIKVSITTSELILFTKLKADIYRYLAEHAPTTEARANGKAKAHNEYRRAALYCKHERDMLEEHRIERVSPINLGVYLNQAIFDYEIEKEKKKALRSLKLQIREALDAFDKWQPHDFEKIKHQVELIQENILIWKEEVDTDSDEEN